VNMMIDMRAILWSRPRRLQNQCDLFELALSKTCCMHFSSNAVAVPKCQFS